MHSKKTALLILDGWGIGTNPDSDAIQQANTPYIDSLLENYPNSKLVTFGEQVGLPDGQMGNSEVGHLNIGAGRIVYQELARINKAVRERTLHQNKVLLQYLNAAKSNDKAIHFIGLLSDGGVHSHIEHLKALCDIAEEQDCKKVYIHAFLDGRDTDPNKGADYLVDLIKHIAPLNAELASVVGRYYAMDRDKRWERIKLAYDLLVHGTGEPCMEVVELVKERYAKGETDEFIMPIVCTEMGKPVATIQDGDTVICFNFRTDRPRQITEALTQQDFPEQDMKKLDIHFAGMTRYDESFQDVGVLFEKDNINNTLGEVLEAAEKTQVRIAETEKYPHVTFFFSGGREATFEGERRLMVASPKVATYDLQPEMSAVEITDTIIEDVNNNQPDFICLNYANTDMVGHTGVFEAAKIAAQTVDTCVKRLMETLQQYDYDTIIIADHGNSDFMINENGTPNTAHTTNLVPCIFVSNDINSRTIKDGKLADIAPTLLHLMGIQPPNEMTGDLLIH